MVRLRALGLCVGLLLLTSPTHAREMSIGASFGVGYLPIKEWEEFDGLGRYDPDAVGLYGEIFARMRLAGRHALAISIERIAKSASLDTAGTDVEWDFTGVPINVNYEYSLFGGPSGTSQFVGFGVGLYHSEVDYVASGEPGFAPSNGDRDGWGAGFHGYFGHRAMVARSLAVSARVRGRWAEGTALTEEAGEFDIDFHGFDFSVGTELLF